jgi:hypothetical protein
MDKTRFIEVAPIYYALAVCEFFKNARPLAYLSEIEHFFTDEETAEDDEYCYLSNRAILEKAMQWLESKEMIEGLHDDFGPSVFRITITFHDKFQSLADDRGSIFYKYSAVSNERGWLKSALAKLNSEGDRLDVEDADFENPDSDWEPLPLDRANYNLKSAISALDEVIEKVRADNGYNSTLPEERNFVLEGLSVASRSLKESTSTSMPFLRKYAWEPLEILVHRFKDAAIAVAAAGAKEAILEFIKQFGVKLLEGLFK